MCCMYCLTFNIHALKFIDLIRDGVLSLSTFINGNEYQTLGFFRVLYEKRDDFLIKKRGPKQKHMKNIL